MYVCVCARARARAHEHKKVSVRPALTLKERTPVRPSARQRAAPAHGSTARVCVGLNLVRVYVRARLSCLPSLSLSHTHTHSHSLSIAQMNTIIADKNTLVLVQEHNCECKSSTHPQ